MRLPALRFSGFSRETFVSLIVVGCVLVFALPIVLALWPSQQPAALPNGTTLDYSRAELSDVELADCAADWIDADSHCGQATAHLDDRATQEIGITREGWVAGLEDGDRVVIQTATPVQGEVLHSFHSVERGTSLAIFAAITLALVALSVGGKGLRAFVSLLVSALFIWLFLVTGVHEGGNPLIYSALTAVLVVTVVLHFTHGFGAKTLAAWAGTVAGVGAAMLAGWIFSSVARLTGITETTSAAVFVTGDIDISVLALAALLIALIGILNDITVAQASVVFSLLGFQGEGGHDHGHSRGGDATYDPHPSGEPATRRSLRKRQPSLMKRALDVGQDHAASAIYTVSFSVVGASLAAFVAAKSYGMPVWALLQSETVAHTIVQLLAGIVGLTVTMPATTLFAIWFARRLRGSVQEQTKAP
ncbi:YibE/F family protein [Brevibacterium jeotgali]|uniref:YibE/F-like protein n=1 Tax=Brevibacterium jeotgali TaxID=1262550 RepID=A0A2H1L7L9_9MICO|nr:YibE/F family protein [Brevibacterium jeotgali]TWC03453.1 YibE/F-like protein [Brevibacterium jeotgali]SMY12882.1 YibE/F-like protein [Brevibacterium jeotgali]